MDGVLYVWVRTFPCPAVKRTHFTDKVDLETNGWVKEVSETIQRFNNYGKKEHLDFSFQSFPFGGKYSMFRKIGVDNPLDCSLSSELS